MRALMKGLLSCPHSAAKLRELHLDNVGVSDSSAQALAQLVACNLQLRVLSLNDNKIGDCGVLSLARVLPTSGLQQLRLSANPFAELGSDGLARAAEQTQALTSLVIPMVPTTATMPR